MVKVAEKTLKQKATIQTMESRTKLPDFGMYFVGEKKRETDRFRM